MLFVWLVYPVWQNLALLSCRVSSRGRMLEKQTNNCILRPTMRENMDCLAVSGACCTLPVLSLSKPVCHNFGSVCLQIGSTEFWELGQKGAFLVHSAISKPKIDGFGARPSWFVDNFVKVAQPKKHYREHCTLCNSWLFWTENISAKFTWGRGWNSRNWC